MAYINIPETDIEVGDIITADLAYKIKNNLDDLNTRLVALANAQAQGGGGMKIAENLKMTRVYPNTFAWTSVHLRTIPAGRVGRLTLFPMPNSNFHLRIDNVNAPAVTIPTTIDLPAGTVISIYYVYGNNLTYTVYLTEYSN